MRLLILGDVMGRSGRELVYRELPHLRERYDLDFVIVLKTDLLGWNHLNF